MATLPHLAAGLTEAEWFSLPFDWRVRLLVAPMIGRWRYRTGAGQDIPWSGFGGPNLVGTGTERIDCSTLTAMVITRAYDRPWTGEDWSRLQVYGEHLPENPDAPIDLVEDQQLGMRVNQLPATWCLVQGWRESTDPAAPLIRAGGRLVRAKGHSILVAGDGMVLESSSLSGGIGPRWKVETVDEIRARFPLRLDVAILGS